MSELSFLLDLMFNHKLPKSARDLVMARVKEVELGQRMIVAVDNGPNYRAPPPSAPSSRDVAQRHPDLVPVAAQPVAVIAQTPQAVAAMNSRQIAINESLAGKVDKTSGRPRKF